MSIGLDVVNDDGKFQITEGYFNLLFKAKIEITVPPNTSYRALEVEHPGSPECFIVTHSDIIYATISPSFTHNPTNVVTYSVANLTNQPQKFTVVIFDTPENIPDLGYGLQVFNSQGKMTYTAAAPLKLTLSTMPQGKVGFYVRSLAYYYKTSSRTYVKVDAVRINNGVTQYQLIECDIEVTISGGTIEGDHRPQNRRTEYIDLNDIL